MSEPSVIRILLADDNLLMRLGVAALLKSQPDFQVVGEAADGAAAVTQFRTLRPDVMLLDLRMPQLDGVAVTSQLCQELPDARILILSHYDGDEHVFKAVKAGARGYLTKEMHGDEIVTAIRTVHRGERYLPSMLLERLADHMRQEPLTARETQVLACLFKGLKNREIAQELSLSEKTASIYVGNILAKLGARSRTEAVSIALRRGLVTAK